MSRLALAGLLISPQVTTTDPAAAAALANHARALGGDTFKTIHSRVTHGTFDNGRTRMPFVTYEKAPNKRVTVIGTHAVDSPSGSARGFDGRAGWDKNFIGTGLRDVTGRELQDLAREADLWSLARPADACITPATVSTPSADGSTVLRCDLGEARAATFFFSPGTGLLRRRDVEDTDRLRSAYFEDYRELDGARLPFRTRYITGPSTVTYTVSRVEHNVPVEDTRFERPKP